jgi:hypothetical protein
MAVYHGLAYALTLYVRVSNAEGVPTLSGKGRWQKGTIGNLLAQIQD